MPVAGGYSAWLGTQEVLEGRTPPQAIYMELHPDAMEEVGSADGAVGLLKQLHALGYTDISHSGWACLLSSPNMLGFWIAAEA